MICKKCGKEISEGAKFCSFCGAPCEKVPAVPRTGMPWDTVITSGNLKAAPSDNKKKLILIIGCAAVALVAVILLCVLLIPRGSSGSSAGGSSRSSSESSPEKVFKAYVKGTFSCDYKAIWNNHIYAKEAQKALDLYDKDDYEDDYQDFKEYYEDLKADFKDDGIKYKVSIDIKKVEKFGKSKEEYEWAQELLEDYYNCSAGKVKEFAIVEARVKAEYYEEGDRDTDYDIDTGTTQYLLVKIGGNWYMTEFSRDDIKEYLKDYYR